jgi:hypothetical protein
MRMRRKFSHDGKWMRKRREKKAISPPKSWRNLFEKNFSFSLYPLANEKRKASHGSAPGT